MERRNDNEAHQRLDPLHPAVAVMNRLKYPQKFLLISLVFAAPLAMAMHQLNSELNSRIEFSAKEVLGDEYLRPLRRLLEHVPQSARLAYAYARGSIAARPELIQKQSEIQEDFDALDRVHGRLGRRLAAGSRYRSLRENWKFLKAKTILLNAQDTDSLHTVLIAEIRKLMSHVGDTSNLILDPDLDTYYLMDSVLLKLPEGQDLLAEARRLAVRVVEDGKVTSLERQEIIRLNGLVKSNMDATGAGMEVAFRNNPARNLEPILENPLRQYVQATRGVLQLLSPEAMHEERTEAFAAASGTALEASFNLWDRNVQELDGLLIARMQGFERKKHVIQVAAIISIAAACYLWLAFYASVMRTVTRLAEASQRMVGGDFSEPIALSARDELAEVAKSFNRVATQLRTEWTQARDESHRARAAEEQLRAGEAQLRLIVDSAHDAFVAMDANGAIVAWNPQAERIFGWTREEAVGRDLAETIVPAEFREAHRSGLRHFLETGQGPVLNRTLELKALHRNGRDFPVELSISPLQSNGSHTFSAFLRDITERKQAEAELQTAKESAEAASRAKSDFLASMSHEIRTPMNGVIGMTGLLMSTDLTPEQREYAEIVRGSAESLLGIINDILDFSKIEAGRLTIEPIPFDLRLAVEEIADLLAPRVQEKGLDFIIRYAPNAPRHVVGDPGRIRQILINLTGNAIKFTSTGHVLIDIECEEQTDRDTTLRLSVTDTGIGIPDDKLESIFGAFTQADASTTRKYGGTGLGLAVSRRLVDIMGGTLKATSRLGMGSTFWFRLKLPLDLEPRIEPMVRGDLSGVRILIVDDNEVNRRVIEEQVKLWRMASRSVASGEEALEAMRAQHLAGEPFQAAILDYQMPGMDGEMLGRLIKEEPALKDTVLVMMTSAPQAGDAKLLNQIGFAAYLSKPARQSHLHDALALAWGNRLTESPPLITRHTIAGATAARETDSTAPHVDARILVAEDNVVNQKLAVRMLEQLGCRVDVAANGSEALTMLEMLPYDLVFMDCEMPEMDGYEATRQIRQRRSIAAVPIVAMTANAMQGDRERCLRSGMDDYVSKPVSPSLLRAALARWLPSSQGAQVPDRLTVDSNGSAQSDSALDLDVIERLRAMGDPGFLHTLLDSFEQQAAERIVALRQAQKNGEAENLRRSAHALKGSCASIGAARMARLCQALEDMGQAQSVAEAGDLIDGIETEYREVLPGLRQQLESDTITAPLTAAPAR